MSYYETSQGAKVFAAGAFYLMRLVHVALESMQHVVNLGKAVFLEVTPGFDRAPPRAADQHHRPVDRCRLARMAEKIGVDVPVGAVLPGDVDRPRRMADEQVFDFRAAVDEHRFGVLLKKGMGFGGFGMMGPGMMGGRGMMGGWSGGGFGWGGLLFIALVIVGIVLIARGLLARPAATSDGALEILRQRLAKGEITKEQFEELRKTLQ